MKLRPIIKAERTPSTMTLTPETTARLTRFAMLTGIPRGRIVDMAMQLLEPCEACTGSGYEGDTVCGECRGDRLVPNES